MADPYKNNVVLALRMEGERHGSTIIRDLTGKTVTVNGNAALSTTVAPPFGTTSCYFDGTGDYLTLPNSDDYSFGTGDFTIECWVNSQTTSGTYVGAIANTGTGATGQYHWRLGVRAGSANNVGFTFQHSTAWVDVYPASAVNVNDSQWHHLAVVRRNGTITVFVDGVARVSTYSAEPVGTTGRGCYVGYNAADTTYYTGYIKDVRITKGVARYTGNFTPSQTTTVDDADWASVVLAVHGEGTGTTFTDVSNSARTITTNGNTTHSTAVAPPFGTSSCYFDGTGDYLSLADSDDFNFGAGDFTVECWVRFSAWPAGDTGSYAIGLIAKDTEAIGGEFAFLVIGTSSSITQLTFRGFSAGNTQNNLTVTGLNFSLNTWYHLTYSRNSGWGRLFIDGTIVGEGAHSFTMQNVSAPLLIGRYGWNATYLYQLPGYIKDLRITKGVARYTQNFTPKYAPFPDKTAIKTIAKPFEWDEPEQPRIFV